MTLKEAHKDIANLRQDRPDGTLVGLFMGEGESVLGCAELPPFPGSNPPTTDVEICQAKGQLAAIRQFFQSWVLRGAEKYVLFEFGPREAPDSFAMVKYNFIQQNYPPLDYARMAPTGECMSYSFNQALDELLVNVGQIIILALELGE